MANLSNINDIFKFTDGEFLLIGGATANSISGTETGIAISNSNAASLSLQNTTNPEGNNFTLFSNSDGSFIIRDVGVGDRFSIDENGDSTFAGEVAIRSDQGASNNAVLRLRGKNTTNRITRLQFEDYSGALADGLIQFRVPTSGVASSAILELGVNSTALTLNASGNATFTGSVTASSFIGTLPTGQFLPLTAGTSSPLTDSLLVNVNANNKGIQLANSFALDNASTFLYLAGKNTAGTFKTGQLELLHDGSLKFRSGGSGTTTTYGTTALTLDSDQDASFAGSGTFGDAVRINGTTTTGLVIASSSGASNGLKLYNNSSTDNAYIYNHFSGNLEIGTSNATVLTMNGTTSTFAGSITSGIGNNFDPIIREGRVAATPAYSFTGDLDTGMFNPNLSNTIAFGTGGVERLRIDSSGNVGIGMTSPTYKLVVAQSNVTEPSGIDANTSILIKNNTWSGITMISTEATGNFITFGDNAAGFAGRIQYSHANNAMQFETAAIERMRITSGGNINLGTGSLGQVAYQLRVDSDFDNGLYMSAGSSSSNYAMYIESGAGSTLFNVRGDGNIGIGTTAPGRKLDINAGSGYPLSIDSTQQYLMEFARNGTSRWWIAVEGGFKFHENGVGDHMIIQDGGNVGIGVTSPDAKLEVRHATYANTNETAIFTNGNRPVRVAYDTVIVAQTDVPCLSIIETPVDNNQATEQKLTLAVGDFSAVIGTSATTTNGIHINTNRTTNAAGYLTNNGINVARFLNNGNAIFPGNVGIATTSPGSKLDIGTSSGASMQFLYDTSQTYRNNISNYWNSSTDSRMDFNIGRTANVAPTTIMSVGYGSNVGIGTITPGAKLDVVGPSNGSAILKLQRNGVGAYQYFVTDIGSGAQQLFCDAQQADSGFVFRTRDSSNATVPALFLAPSGNVGIGETSPDTTLHVKNSGSIVLTIERSGNGKAVSFTNGIQEVGFINYNSNNTVTYSQTSDYRLKEDLQDFNGLDKISKIKMYDYKWKSSNDRNYGAMAHELQEILPYSVTGEKDGEEMQGVDYSKIVPLLVKSIQEQQKQIKELQDKSCTCNNCNCDK